MNAFLRGYTYNYFISSFFATKFGTLFHFEMKNKKNRFYDLERSSPNFEIGNEK